MPELTTYYLTVSNNFSFIMHEYIHISASAVKVALAESCSGFVQSENNKTCPTFSLDIEIEIVK